MLLCKKNKQKRTEEPGPQSVLDEVIGNEDLAFLISSYVSPNPKPSWHVTLCHNPCIVSRWWNEAFSLVRAQLRYDYLMNFISEDEKNDWLHHKLIYLPGTSIDDEGRAIPREGCLRIFRSNCNKTCNDARQEYRNNIQNDTDGNDNRVDSRPDYYYQAHRETPECIELILPRPLPYNDAIHFVNEIEYDERPRLVNKFVACIGDINGLQNPMTKEKSKEGQWNLGYHEIVSVRDMTTTKCDPRPPLNGHGEYTTSFLRATNAKPSDDPRWVKFCHLVGREDRCRAFLKKCLLPMMGPRPTGHSWNSSPRD